VKFEPPERMHPQQDIDVQGNRIEVLAAPDSPKDLDELDGSPAYLGDVHQLG